MRFTRPQAPANFETVVKNQRKAVEDAVGANTAPKFRDLWGGFKDAFAAAQHGRCGYCDQDVIGTQDGDVEHYAPKSEVSVLGQDETTWGAEAPNLARVKGRKPIVLSPGGYWWLAYDWSNYLLACGNCNRKWKGSIFPVKEPPARAVPPGKGTPETSLLLNPFEGPDPAKHLRFDESGAVAPLRGSKRGLETIKTVGLNRPSLQLQRGLAVEDALESIRELADAQIAGDPAKVKEALRDLVRRGDERRAFAGCVRAVAQQQLKQSWTEIEAAASAP
jgi:hypothetical protein